MNWGFYYNRDPNCPANVLAAEYDIELDSNSAVMRRTQRTGDMIFLIRTTTGQCYMWNLIENSLVKVDHEGGPKGIVDDIKARGMSFLAMTVV